MKSGWLVPWVGVWLVGAGCGTPAAPAPPSLNLPTPVANLSAVRIGNAVRLNWTMPTRTTDKVALRRPIIVEACRAVQNDKCATIGIVNVEPGMAGAYKDELPAELTQGPDRLLRYEIALRNHAGKSAGPSNAAFSAAGMSLPALRGLTAQMRREGVQLGWQPASEPISDPRRALFFRIDRVRLTTGDPERSGRSLLVSSPSPTAETLVVRSPDGRDPGHAVDASALSNQQYRYTVERVAAPELGGQAIQVQGAPSEPIVITTTDKFPPAVPQGLVAIADEGEGAIDLSWTPDGDADLSGYYLYRRELGGTGPAQRVASVGLETGFRDVTIQPGRGYAYSVSASDQSGNESPRCAEVEETLPQRPLSDK